MLWITIREQKIRRNNMLPRSTWCLFFVREIWIWLCLNFKQALPFFLGNGTKKTIIFCGKKYQTRVKSSLWNKYARHTLKPIMIWYLGFFVRYCQFEVVVYVRFHLIYLNYLNYVHSQINFRYLNISKK